MDTDDSAARAKLTHAMARLVACRQQLDHHREQIRSHATDRLDGHVHAIQSASESLQDPDRRNVLSYRYLRTQMTEAARLRAIEGRGKARDADESE